MKIQLEPSKRKISKDNELSCEAIEETIKKQSFTDECFTVILPMSSSYGVCYNDKLTGAFFIHLENFTSGFADLKYKESQ